MIVSYVEWITGYYIIMVTAEDIIILLLSYMVTVVILSFPIPLLSRAINQTIITYPMLTVGVEVGNDMTSPLNHLAAAIDKS